jgi:non-ribosomal peptide synthetase component E (peptide arylation enzyme)
MTSVISLPGRAERIGGDRDAVTCGGRRLTYAETAERCRRLGGALSKIAGA